MTAIPVLLYHRVADVPGDQYAVSRERFRSHVAAISASGRTPLTVSALAACLRGTAPLPERPVLVTIDDAYRDTPEAIDVLAEAGLPATVFVTTGAVDSDDRITADQVRALAARPQQVELGAHTVSHPRLDELTAAGAEAEIAGSKAALEALAGRPITSFAYPHGAYDARARELVIAAGFRCAAAVKNALSHTRDDPWAIARVTVRGTTTAARIRELLDGEAAPLAWDGERLRTRAYRSVRRMRRRLAETELPAAPSAPAAANPGPLISAGTTESLLAASPQVSGADAPVAVRILDLADPAPILDSPTRPRSDGRYGTAAVLVRRGPRPLGWVTHRLDGTGTLDRRCVDEAIRAGTQQGKVAPDCATDELPGPVSVICTTCADAEATVRCVSSLLTGAPADLEIIVVDNRPARSRVLEALEAAVGSHPAVRYIEASRPGLSTARNAGLAAATGRYVAFVDDDVVADAHWLATLRAAFAAEPDAAAVTGPILPLELERGAQVLIEQFGAFNKGFAPRRYSLAEPAPTPLFPYAAGHLGSGANMAFRTDVLRGLGGFDTALGAGTIARGGEDLDICVRLIASGHTLVYEPGAIVWHRHPDSAAAVGRRAYGYGVGLGAMLGKHLLFGTERLRVLRLVPSAVRYLLNPQSRKNAAKPPDFPRRLTALERVGLLVGPIAYLLARLPARSPAVRPASARHVWSGEFEWTAPAAPGELRTGAGQPFHSARLLVRVHGEPVGFVEVPVTRGRLDAPAVLEAARGELGQLIDAALAAPAGPAAPAATVTVVVCTRSRPAAVDRCLGVLRAIEDPDLEVILVDNAPHEQETRRVVQRHAAADARVRYVAEPRAGLSRARNRGLREASGELIAFTDDDVRPDPRWLDGIRHGFARRGDVACVTGLVASASLEQPAERLFDARVSWSSSCEPAIYDLTGAESQSRLHPFAAGRFGTGANMAFRTATLRALGGFDEALGAGSAAGGGEDLDIFLRVLLAGHALSYEPGALVWHEHRVDVADLEVQLHNYGKGLAAYLCKYLLARATRRQLAGRALRGAGHLRLIFRRAQTAGEPVEVTSGLRRAELRGLLSGAPAYLTGSWRQSRRRREELRP